MNGKCERRKFITSNYNGLHDVNLIIMYFAGDIQMTPEVQYIIPLVGQNNSHMFTVQTYTNSEVGLHTHCFESIIANIT